MFEFFSSVFRRSSLLPLVVLGLLAPRLMAQADLQGQWSVASYQMPINPVHAALLKNGKVLVVAGSGNCLPLSVRLSSGRALWAANGSGALLVDPTTGAITQFTFAWDMFCNGMLVLAGWTCVH